MSSSEPTLIAVNPVRADRADDFAQWLRSVVVPAVKQHRPEQEGRWQVLRAREAEDGVVVFAFVFDGGSEEEWELEPLLQQALGAEGAGRALEEMGSMLTGDQYGWTFSDVALDS